MRFRPKRKPIVRPASFGQSRPRDDSVVSQTRLRSYGVLRSLIKTPRTAAFARVIVRRARRRAAMNARLAEGDNAVASIQRT